MKILHIVPSYLPATRYGGPIQSVHNLNKALVGAGAEVTVYTTNADGAKRLNVPTGIPVDMDGVKIVYFPLNFPAGWYYSAGLRKALKEKIKNFDIVHITSTFLSASTLGAHYAKKFGIPYIISPRGNLMRGPLATSAFKKKIYINLIERRSLAGASAIHFTSEEERADYAEGGFPLEREIIVPNGVDVSDANEVSREEITAFKAANNILPQEKVVVCFGRISKIKGFDVLIPAMKSLKDSGEKIRLLVVGGDDNKGYLSEVKGMVTASGLQNNVVFSGMLAGREKRVALAAADVLVQPSESESFGMAAAEAMSMGLPVVVTAGVGLADLIKKTNSGIVIRKDAGELASAIKKLISDDGGAKEMGLNGRAAAEKYLSSASVADKFIAEYNSIIKEHAKNK